MTQAPILANQPSVNQGRKQAVRPLTHHEILALIGPFTRRGHQADMAATRREERRLVFVATEHSSHLKRLPLLRQVLELEISERGWYRLIRTLTATDPAQEHACLSATLTAAGPDPDVLLELIDDFPRTRQFPVHGDIPVPCSYQFVHQAQQKGGSRATWVAALTKAQAGIQGVTLEIDADHRYGLPVQLRMTPPSDQRLVIPEDLLAVIGWSWRPVEDYISHWRGKIRVPKREPHRTPDIEAKLGQTVTHLSATLSRSPQAFHHRHRRERWRASAQRAIPLTVTLALIAATPAVNLLPMGEGSMLRMLIFHAPPLMLVGLFLLSEIPRIEIPPLPRPLKQQRWLCDKS